MLKRCAPVQNVWQRGLRKCVFTAMILMGILTGCVKVTAFDVTELSCKSYGPIHWSLKDTDQTIAAIKQHNAAWLALCAK